MIEFRMPSLGADMDAGTIVEWLKQPGDVVTRGDIIAVVETQKGAIEIEVFEDGILGEVRVPLGSDVPVGTVLATIHAPGEQAEVPPAAPRPEPVAVSTIPDAAGAGAIPAADIAVKPSRLAPVSTSGSGRLKVTPAARRAAASAGLDLAAIAPGKDGVIGMREVSGIAVAAPGSPRVAETPRSQGFDRALMREAIAAAMARSKREIPHYYVGDTIDLSALLSWLETENRKRTTVERLLLAAPLIKAAALALRATSELNGHWIDDAFHPADGIHVGVATAIRGGGLIAPALHDADRLDLDEVMDGLRDLTVRVRGGRLRSSQMSDPTVTLSFLGEDTAETLVPIIYPPQVAIIGCGAPKRTPVAQNDQVVIRTMMTVTVSGDHRVSDGRAAARFLNRLAELLHAPESL